MRSDGPAVAVVGATGAAGGTLVRILGERSFPASTLTSSRARAAPAGA